jgi:hypothetical protein
VSKRIKIKSGANAVAKKFGEDKIIPNKKKDYTVPSWE